MTMSITKDGDQSIDFPTTGQVTFNSRDFHTQSNTLDEAP